MARSNKFRSKPKNDGAKSFGSKPHAVKKKSADSGKQAKQPTAGKGQVMVNGYSEQWLRQHFDWVYDQEVLSIGSDVQMGDVVEILSQQRQVLGVGIYAGQNGEQAVAVRRFDTTKRSLDVEFFESRIRAAKDRRTIEPNTTAWRLVHSENDDLPGIVVDCWGDALSLTLSCASLKSIVEPLLAAIERVHQFENIVGHVRLPHGKQEYLGVLKGSFLNDLWYRSWDLNTGCTRSSAKMLVCISTCDHCVNGLWGKVGKISGCSIFFAIRVLFLCQPLSMVRMR